MRLPRAELMRLWLSSDCKSYGNLRPIIIRAEGSSLLAAPAAHSLAIGELYLLRSRRFDPRATAFFNPAANPYLSAGELLRFEACRHKITLIRPKFT